MAELRQIAARYPQPRSALLPMLHLVQSVDGRISPAGIEACAEILGITTAQVSGVATFYTMYRRRPGGKHHVGVCTTALCAVMGGDALLEQVEREAGHPRGRDHRRRRVQPGAARVQRRLRLRAGDDGQLGVHGQHDPARPRRAAGRPRRRPGGQVHPRRRRSRRGARPSACWPASPTAAPTRARAPGEASLLGKRHRRARAGRPGRRRHREAGGSAK